MQPLFSAFCPIFCRGFSLPGPCWPDGPHWTSQGSAASVARPRLLIRANAMPQRLLTLGLRFPATLLAALLQFSQANAEVVAVDIRSRAPLDTVGTSAAALVYQELRGSVHFAVDPLHPANALIADIAAAPRNAQGKVEFSAENSTLPCALRGAAAMSAISALAGCSGSTAKCTLPRSSW